MALLTFTSISNKSSLFCLWAVFVGVSVSFDIANQVTLNGRASRPDIQSLYTSTILQATDLFLLLPFVLLSSAPWPGKPTRWWSLCGGLCSIPILVMPLSVSLVGLRTTQLLVLCVQLASAFVLDVSSGAIRISDAQRLAGFAVVLLGAIVNARDEAGHGCHLHASLGAILQSGNASRPGGQAPLYADASIESKAAVSDGFNAAHGMGYEELSGGSPIFFLMAVLGGVGVALEAKCSCELAKDLDCWSRAACWRDIVALFVSVPVASWFYVKWAAVPVVLASDWYRFLFSGTMQAFFHGSLAILPRRLGFTACFMCLKFGCLLASTCMDVRGLGLEQVPVSTPRLIALILVFSGAVLFTSSAGSDCEGETLLFHNNGYGAAGTRKCFAAAGGSLVDEASWEEPCSPRPRAVDDLDSFEEVRMLDA